MPEKITPARDGTDMSWASVCGQRMRRHALWPPAPAGTPPADVVAAMCGAHAQVLSAAELSIGLRIEELTRIDVRTALWVERSLVKTYGPRGTVHLLPTRDLPMWTAALSAIPAGTHPTPAQAAMTAEQTEAVIAAIATALRDAELTIDELNDAVVDTAGLWAGDRVVPAFQEMWPRWRQVITTAAHRGVLCFGENRGRKVTYTNPHRWLPNFQPADEKAALARVVRDYLRGYGPATPRQFAQWFGAPPRWAQDLFAGLTGAIRPVNLAGAKAWLAADDTAIAPPAPDPASPDGVRLLPYFDAYVVGSHPRQMLFAGRAADRALSRTGQAGTFPVLLVNGSVRGVWHQRRAGRHIDITVEPLDPLTAIQRRSLTEQVDKVARILEGTPRLTIGPVTVGSHA